MKFSFNLLFLTLLISNFALARPTPAIVTFNQIDSSCHITFHNQHYRCALGRTGVTENKKEGDGATPIGKFKIRKIYYRPDRIDPHEVTTNIPLVALTKNDGWCDDVNSAEYNKAVKLPFAASHENLWREDHVYDIIAVIGYNDDPVVKGKGSAIFLHIARENYTPTAGCIALNKDDLLKFINQFNHANKIIIERGVK